MDEIIKFIIGEIPFLIVFGLYIYFAFIRPKRKEKRERELPSKEIRIGDEVLFKDGMVGIVVKHKNNILTVESGSNFDKYMIKDSLFSENLSGKERIDAAISKLSFWQKILNKI